MSLYQPNFTDIRVQRRCKSALAWVNTFVGSTPQWLSTREIDKHFTNKPLGQYLRQQLLICEDSYYNMASGKCKQYVRNVVGCHDLYQQVYGTASTPTSITDQQHAQLTTGEFVYTEKANRYFNDIQQLPKRIKRPMLASSGYNYGYDINCCAPTLLLQYARNTCGFDALTPVLDQYILDRQSIRRQIALETDLTENQVKFVINAMLHGAPISHKTDSSIFVHIKNHMAIDKLKTNSYIQGIKEEIRLMWRSIKPYITSTSLRLSGRDKAKLYRELEQQVILVIKRYLRKTHNKGLLEHDGWTCQKAIDETELRSYVRSHTGYVIKLDWDIYE